MASDISTILNRTEANELANANEEMLANANAEIKRWQDYNEAMIAEMVNEKALLAEQIRRIEQQMAGIDRCITIMTRDDVAKK